jgi:histidinol phosphatase-like enzyme
MFVDAIYYSMNKQKLISEAIKQGSNARMKALLPDNQEGGLTRQMPQSQEGNELDEYMKASLRVGGVKI